METWIPDCSGMTCAEITFLNTIKAPYTILYILLILSVLGS